MQSFFADMFQGAVVKTKVVQSETNFGVTAARLKVRV